MKRLFSIFIFLLCLFLVGCAEDHGHSFEPEWSYDGTSHWKSCRYEGCQKKVGLSLHSWSDYEEIVSPTEINGGISRAVCTVCGAASEIDIPPLSHTHSIEQTVTSDTNSHWYACSGCGYKYNEAEHVFESFSVIKEPTDKEEGIARYLCSVCGASKNEVLQKLPPKMPEESWIRAFAFENMRIDQTFYMGSLPSSDIYLIDEDIVRVGTDDSYKYSGRAILAEFDFSDYYDAFVHKGNGVYTADRIDFSLDESKYIYSDCRVVFMEDNLLEIAFSVDIGFLFGNVKQKYSFSEWGKIKLMPERLTSEKLDSLIRADSFTGDLAIVKEEWGDEYRKTEITVSEDHCFTKVYDLAGKTISTSYSSSENVPYEISSYLKALFESVDTSCFVYSPTDETYTYIGPSVDVGGRGEVLFIDIILSDGRLESLSYTNESGLVNSVCIEYEK
ncbi:MAG: hypothetical protein IJD79_07295 [Clostridia bacterium]|nr:hypothetical protein [Clostridia bacterium]